VLPSCATGLDPTSSSHTSGSAGGHPGAGGSTSSGGVGGVNFGDDGGGLGCPTTVSGTVFAPSGKLPLYDVVVYVPREPLSPIAEGAACETCDGYFSGKPIAAALSDAAGNFKMDVTAVKSATDVPIVIQVGKWRRQITIPSITACTDTPIDPSLT